MNRTFLFLFCILCMVTTILFPGTTPVGAEEEPGKLLIRERCVKCHDLRRVKARIGKLDASEWTDILNLMIKKGVKLTAEEKGEVIRFLTVQSSPEALD